MKKNFYFVFILTSFALLSCNDDETCQNKELVVNQIESVVADCTDPKHGLIIELIDDYTIIRSQQEFESRVTGSCDPTPDFTSYDLVIGKKTLNTGNESITYKLVQDCTKKLKLIVKFKQNAAAVAPNLTYHALIAKLGDEETVEVELTMTN